MDEFDNDEFDNEYIEREKLAYSKMVTELEKYIDFEYPIGIDNTDVISPSLLGILKEDFFDLEEGVNVYLVFKYPDNFGIFDFKYEYIIIYVYYIFEMDLVDYIDKYGDELWYEDIFVVGKGSRSFKYIVNDNIFKPHIITDLPGRQEVDDLIDQELIEAEIEVEHPAISNGYFKRNDILTIEKVKNNDVLLDSYTLGKLQTDFLDIPAGFNILIEWPDKLSELDLYEDETEYCYIFYISDDDMNKFHLSQRKYLWYQHVFVPGKEVITCEYSSEGNTLTKSTYKRDFFIENNEKFVISENYANYFDDVDTQLLYYGITWEDFLIVPKNNLLVVRKTKNPKYYEFTFVDLNVGSEYGYEWYHPQICIIGKRRVLYSSLLI